MLNDRIEERAHRRLTVSDELDVRKLPKRSVYLATPTSDFARSSLATRKGRLLRSMVSEGYFLDISEDGVVLLAHPPRGRYYGMMTLLGLLRSDGRRVVLPYGTIHDWPKSSLRGLRLLIEETETWTKEDFLKLIPLCASFKLNTLIITVSADVARQPSWDSDRGALNDIAAEHWIDLQLERNGADGSARAPLPVFLEFLPPGSDLTSRMASLLQLGDSAPRSLTPAVSFKPPVLLSSQWLGYCAGWIAQHLWSTDQAHLGLFNQAFFRQANGRNTDAEAALQGFSLLQIIPADESWNDLWLRPSAGPPCLHAVSRRHALESVTTAVQISDAKGDSPIGLAVRLRLQFLEYRSARLRALEILARTPERTGPIDDVFAKTSSSIRSVRTVIRCLDQLEEGVLDLSPVIPFRRAAPDLIGAISFQRQIWSEALARLESGGSPSSLFNQVQWMTPPMRIIADSTGVLLFRRRFQSVEPPIQARLTVSSSCMVSPIANGTFLSFRPSSSTPLPSNHARVSVFDLTAELHAGENLLMLRVEDFAPLHFWSFSFAMARPQPFHRIPFGNSLSPHVLGHRRVLPGKPLGTGSSL
jgi:hypothetical protein